ncbi:MAG: hypothetical protein IK012_03065, partial [Fibrobacter sp.]|uniref:hypothetical protein n=1 Tax=Fibrobacter sp. TaxID=35828 RepID=UPI0025C0F82F
PGIFGGGIAVYVSFLLMLCDGSALNHTAVACFIAFSIILFVSYIKTIRAITANTRALNSLSTSDTPSTPPDEEPHHEELSEEAVTRDENS